MHIYTSQLAKPSKIFSIWNVITFVLFLALLMLAAKGFSTMSLPIEKIEKTILSNNPSCLPGYALQTVLRMFIAVFFSIIFTFSYGYIAAKSKRAEQILIPLLDILQSVPVLGYISFTVTGFMALFPGSSLGLELASIFAVFTNQVPNMTFSFFQSLKTLPKDLEETCNIFQLSALQKFIRLELPYSMPGLIWNTMMSMSGAWFLIVASEAVTVANQTITLPGVGSYIAIAIAGQNITAIFWAIFCMIVVILIYDQIIFRPIVAWGDKFRYGDVASQVVAESLIGRLLKKSDLCKYIGSILGKALYCSLKILLDCFIPISVARNLSSKIFSKLSPIIVSYAADFLWYTSLISVAIYGLYLSTEFISTTLGISEVIKVTKLGFYTLLRVNVIIILSAIIWVPIGVYIGLRPKLAEKIEPLVQFLAAFPANFLFPFAVITITYYHLNPNIWLSLLMMLGTQWYILFNVIAGTVALPNELKEVSAVLNVKKWLWWKRVILPGISPYLITGAITASGGAWNASIVAEIVSWGNLNITATGIGHYISISTSAGDFPRIALGIGTMSIYVLLGTHLIWRPLYRIAETKVKYE